MKKCLFFLLFIPLLVYASPPNYDFVVSGTLSGFQAVPPVFTPAIGTVYIFVDTAVTDPSHPDPFDNMICFCFDYLGLLGVETGRSFNGPAGPGTNGPIIINNPIQHIFYTYYVHNDVVDDMLNNLTYFAVQTTWTGGDEIRADLSFCASCPICVDCLPVELSSFTAAYTSNGVLLRWRTESEILNDRYIILKSEGNSSYTTIAQIRSAASTGYSPTPLNYEYLDRNVIVGKTYHYRLIQRDVDGTESVLRDLSITLSDQRRIEMPKDWKLLSCYPNPFNSQVKLRLNLVDVENATVEIYNVQGILVYTTDVIGNGGREITWNAEGMAEGLYLVNLKVNGQIIANEKVTYLK